MSSIVELFQAAEEPGVTVLDRLGLGGVWVLGAVGIDPYFCLDSAGPVVELVGCVRCLRGDGADLADECYLSQRTSNYRPLVLATACPLPVRDHGHRP